MEPKVDRSPEGNSAPVIWRANRGKVKASALKTCSLTIGRVVLAYWHFTMKIPLRLVGAILAISGVVSASPDGGDPYEVFGLKPGDSLKIRADAGAGFMAVGTFENGTDGIYVVGGPVFNGPDDWVKIRRGELAGWVRPKYLRLASLRPESTAKAMPNPAKRGTETIAKNQETLDAWKKYEEAAEVIRSRHVTNGPEMLAAIERLSLDGVDTVIRAHFQEDAEYCRFEIQEMAKLRGILAKDLPNRVMRECLRQPAEQLGAKLMPDTGAPEAMREGTGKLIGGLIVDYCFAGPKRTQRVNDAYDWLTVEYDRLRTQEALINVALGQEQPPGLVGDLQRVKERAYANRLRFGHWVCRQNGVVFDLKITDDPKARAGGGGFVDMYPRGKRGAPLSFQWEFGDGEFILTDRGWGAIIGGIKSVTRLEPTFTSPDSFELHDRSGVNFGIWEKTPDRN